MIIKAHYTSVWDGGIEVTAECKVDTETHEIFDIGENDYEGDSGELEVLEREYVTIADDEFEAASVETLNIQKDNLSDKEYEALYWYEL